MLAFPTPRPPAQLRRASAQTKSEPPPPYVHDMSEDAIVYTDHTSPMPVSPWDGQSREELAGLLTRADGLIRHRERELSLTSDLSRELNSNNQTLRQTHQALLARLPASATSPATSPFITSHRGSPLYYSSSLSRNSSDILDSLRSQTSTPARHARRVSISPGELARLADENAELLSKLEELQEESEHADQTGKRRLGKLEDELSVLRRELEAARARSEALEEHNVALQRDSAEAQLRKQEREERMNDVRSKGHEPTTPLPNFAPSTTMIFPSSVSRRIASSSTVVPFASPLSPRGELPEEAEASPSQPSHTPSEISRTGTPASEAHSIGPREHALLAQLLSKVRELEEANEQISRHQQDTTSKLRTAQLEADAIKRLYDYLDENTEIDFQDDNEGVSVESTPTPNSFVFPARDGKPKTIRFRSLRRSLNGELSRFDFDAGIDGDMHSTLRSAQKVLPPKRKALAGLFDSPGRASTATGSSTVVEETRHAGSDDGEISPVLSSISFADDAPAPTLQRRKTLGSELGSDFGDVFTGGGTSGHHHHTSSIFESPSAASSVPVTPSEPPALNTAAFPFPVPSANFSGRPYEEPQTPTSDGNVRMRRLSQTVRARTHRWVDRRLHDSFQSMRLPPDTVSEDQGAPALGSVSPLSVAPISPLPSNAAIDHVFDVVDAIVDRFAQAVAPVGVKLPESHSTATVVPTPTRPARPLSRRKQLAALMIEVWLWLQFAIIVLVFVYAMARRGPKSILKDAERKRRTAH